MLYVQKNSITDISMPEMLDSCWYYWIPNIIFQLEKHIFMFDNPITLTGSYDVKHECVPG
jgi:hypothetical protein